MSQPSGLPHIFPAPPGYRKEEKRENPKRHRADIACQNCRKRRIKCDTRRPTCDKCRLADLACEYETPESFISRREAREKIASYEKSIESFENVIEVLRQGSETDSATALQRIRNTNKLEDAISGISDAQLLLHGSGSNVEQGTEGAFPGGRAAAIHPSWSSSRLLRSPAEDAEYVFSTGYSFARDKFVEKDVFVSMPALRFDFSRWTSVKLSNSLMNHLLALFWTWDNNAERLMYRPMFEEDLADLDPVIDDPVKRRFCSRFLVNALLALSCLYSLESETYPVSENPNTRGRQFAEEADIMLQKEIDEPSIPLYQGLFAMSCYEGSLGEGQKALSYLLQAFETYKKFNHPSAFQPLKGATDPARLQEERYAMSWSMWGFYITEWRASQVLGFRKMVAKPVLEKTWLEPEFPISKLDCSSHWWYPYPISLQNQLSMKIECMEAEVALAEIVETVLDFITPTEGSQPATENPQRAIELYEAIINWKYSLPARLRIEEAVLPSTILLHVYAELMLTAILRPFGQMSRQKFRRFDPRERCFSHASRLMAVIWTYRAFAILRTEYWLIHPISTCTLIVLQDLDTGSAEVDTLIRAGQCLHEMRDTLPLAEDCLSTLNGAFKRLKLQVPAYMQKYLKQARHRKDGIMHRAVASLMPTQNSDSPYSVMDNAWGLSFQELMDELEDVTLD